VTTQVLRLGRCTIALTGAWLPIVFSSSVLLPQHVEAIVRGPSWSASYAAVSATGWLSVIVGLTVSGHLQDTGRLARAGRSGKNWAVPLIAISVLVAGSTLALTTSLPVLAVVWVATLLPAAAGVTLLAARAADCGASTVGAASAIGSAPLLAVFLGSAIVTVAPVTGTGRFPLIAVVATGLMLLDTRSSDRSSVPAAVPPAPAPRAEPATLASTLPPPLPPVTDPVVRGSISRHRRLLAAVALVDTATVTLTFTIVPLVFLLPRDDVAAPGSYAERLVLLATVCSVAAVWLAPRLRGLRTHPRALFVLSGLLAAGALATAPFASATTLLVVALAAGSAVGASNAATFGLFLSDPASTERRATGLGLLNAMPSLPAALVPIAATLLLRWSPTTGLTVLMLASASAAVVGSFVIVAGRRPARTSG